MDEFDLDLKEVNELNAVYQAEIRNNDRRICICGHAMSRHHFDKYDGKHYCKPGQLSCPCLIPRAVIDVPNTRYFMRKSMGAGAKHSLPRGIAASMEALGDDFTERKKWLVPAECDFCHKPAKYFPVRVSPLGKILEDDEKDEGVTAFVCVDCRNSQDAVVPEDIAISDSSQ